jgi:hypothetical protein
MIQVSRFAKEQERQEKEAQMKEELGTLLWLAEHDPAEAARKAGRVCPHCGKAMTPKIVDAPLPWDKSHHRVQWADQCGCDQERAALKESEAVVEGDRSPNDEEEVIEIPRDWVGNSYGR